LLFDKFITYNNSLDIIKSPKACGRVWKGPWYAKVLVCKGPGMQRSSFASSGTSFHLFQVLLMRYNYLQLILCSRKPLRGLCRWGHLYTYTSTHP